jgi:hypothetical protein
MIVRELPDGRLQVPARAADPASGIKGDGAIVIGPQHPDYTAWRAWLRQHPEQLLPREAEPQP